MGESACLMCASQQGWEQAWSILGLQSVSHQCCNVGDAFSVGWYAHRQTPEQRQKNYILAHRCTCENKHMKIQTRCTCLLSMLKREFTARSLIWFVQVCAGKLKERPHEQQLPKLSLNRDTEEDRKKNNERGQRSPEHLFRKWYDQVTNLVHLIIYQCARQWRQSCRF